MSSGEPMTFTHYRKRNASIETEKGSCLTHAFDHSLAARCAVSSPRHSIYSRRRALSIEEGSG